MRNEYAEIIDGVVNQVLVVDGAKEEAITWLNTNVSKNQWLHSVSEDAKGKTIAGRGGEYNSKLKHFIPKKPFNSWVMNDDKLCYDAPVAKPDEKIGSTYGWDEDNLKWNEIIHGVLK